MQRVGPLNGHLAAWSRSTYRNELLTAALRHVTALLLVKNTALTD